MAIFLLVLLNDFELIKVPLTLIIFLLPSLIESFFVTDGLDAAIDVLLPNINDTDNTYAIIFLFSFILLYYLLLADPPLLFILLYTNMLLMSNSTINNIDCIYPLG